MAVILMEGFDTYNGTGTNTGLQAKWSTATGGVSMVAGRFSGQGLQVASNSATPKPNRSFSSAVSSFSFGVAIYNTSTGGVATRPEILFYASDLTTTQLGIQVKSGGVLEVLRMSSTTAGTSLGTTSPSAILDATWQYLEGEIVISDTVGRVTLFVDGTQVLNLTNQDTKNSASDSTVQKISLGSTDGGTGGGTKIFDDLYINDTATKLGERRIETLYPTSDVAQGFTRSTGSTNYTLVDEAQVNGDTDYVQGSTVGDVDTYGFADLSTNPSTIDAVQVNAYALKTDAGTRSIALQVKSGATTSDGSSFGLNASYTKFERILLTDPNTSAAWTASAVNALQGGPKVTV